MPSPLLISRLTLAAACCAASLAAQAIEREDRLDCQLPDGTHVLFRSRYDYSLVPVPLVHASRESDRHSWDARYRDKKGKVTDTPVAVDYHGNRTRSSLEAVCAHVGVLNGVVLGPHTFREADGRWFSSEQLPWELLDAGGVGFVPDRLPPEKRKQMDDAGIKDATYYFAFILPTGKRLVYEQPLHRSREGFFREKTFDAVYQSFSDDHGKTWSPPVVTTDALIFELGKSWSQQSFLAKPVSLNGKKIPEDPPPDNSCVQ
ncbi:hypothetical protein GCM10025771_09660 [Niveibacterium umoris]|uniref:Sialidase domain-containing protein n=1 Tax=Niveibacterium umoris TaxID=1193620 RepID=A0A840BLY2_9RHOO|nr:hypothetical protein [Niveibacterium umoris]MBB4013484.1 hypothetical protein [Niveibacterium umoris]